MPRNSSGIYNPPAGTYAVSGAVISSSAYDAFLTDLSNEISASVNTSGTAAMIAPLNLGSQKIINAAAGSNPTDVATLQNLTGAGTGIVSAGLMAMWPTSAAPAGWFICNGQAVSRSGNPNLFSLVGIFYGAGDGSTTFNLPNWIDRSPIAAGNLYGLGGGYGASTQTLAIANLAAHSHTDAGHTHTDSGHTHSINQGAHNHSATDSGHTHNYTEWQATGGLPVNGSATYTQGSITAATTTGTANITVANATISISNNTGNAVIATSNANIQNTGSGSPFSILHPVFGVYFIIKGG